MKGSRTSLLLLTVLAAMVGMACNLPPLPMGWGEVKIGDEVYAVPPGWKGLGAEEAERLIQKGSRELLPAAQALAAKSQPRFVTYRGYRAILVGRKPLPIGAVGLDDPQIREAFVDRMRTALEERFSSLEERTDGSFRASLKDIRWIGGDPPAVRIRIDMEIDGRPADVEMRMFVDEKNDFLWVVVATRDAPLEEFLSRSRFLPGSEGRHKDKGK